MNEQQGKENEQTLCQDCPNELQNSLSNMTMFDDTTINPVIYSGDTNDLFLFVSNNYNPAINELLQQNAMEKYGLGKDINTEPFVVNDETVAWKSFINGWA